MEVQSFEEFVELIGIDNTFSSETSPVSPPQPCSTILSGSIEELLSGDFMEEIEGRKNERASPKFYVKAAKCRDDQYVETTFPTTMTCTPYKYDLKIVGHREMHCTKEDFLLELVDAESGTKPENSPSETRKGVILEALEVSNKEEQLILRFGLNWCSFHFRRKAFRLAVYYKGKKIFVSSPFHSYARRRETPYHREMKSSQQFNKSLFCSLRNVTPIVNQTAPQIAPTTPQPLWPLYQHPTKTPISPVRSPTLPVVQANSSPHLQPLPIAPKTQTIQSADPGATEHLLSQFLNSMERTSLAIQLMTALSPVERQAVNYYMQGL